MPMGMDQRMTELERAFQLARSGRVAGLTDIITTLKRDGYSASQIEGPLLSDNLPTQSKLRARAGRVPTDGVTHAGRNLTGHSTLWRAMRVYQRFPLSGREQ